MCQKGVLVLCQPAGWLIGQLYFWTRVCLWGPCLQARAAQLACRSFKGRTLLQPSHLWCAGMAIVRTPLRDWQKSGGMSMWPPVTLSHNQGGPTDQPSFSALSVLLCSHTISSNFWLSSRQLLVKQQLVRKISALWSRYQKSRITFSLVCPCACSCM